MRYTLNRCIAVAKMIEPSFSNINRKSSDWITFKVMVLFLFGTLNEVHTLSGLHRATKFDKYIIKKTIENLSSNKIWVEGNTNVDILNEETGFMEIILCTMAAMGDLVRVEVEEKEDAKNTELLDELSKIESERQKEPYEFNKNSLRIA